MSLTIRFIGQSGYLLSDGEHTLCIDPYLSDVVNRVADRPRMLPPPFSPEELSCDAVICTHDHLDHVDIDAIPQMDTEHILFLAPTHAEKTLRGCGVQHYQPFDEGAEYTLGAFRLSAVYAHHTVPAVGILVRHGELLLYFSGDTEYHSRLEALSSEKIDVAFICINGKLGNMNASEAVRLTRILSPRLGIPTHYGMFESNTADPVEYTGKIPHSAVLEYDRECDVKELLSCLT